MKNISIIRFESPRQVGWTASGDLRQLRGSRNWMRAQACDGSDRDVGFQIQAKIKQPKIKLPKIKQPIIKQAITQRTIAEEEL